MEARLREALGLWHDQRVSEGTCPAASEGLACCCENSGLEELVTMFLAVLDGEG